MAASVGLIAYASRLGGDLGRLREILAGLFAGVHVLPFYVPFDGAEVVCRLNRTGCAAR